jgi:sterol desaturase/sphingolipid hydroxylase (fatty acid hydroxylase superfamily)
MHVQAADQEQLLRDLLMSQSMVICLFHLCYIYNTMEIWLTDRLRLAALLAACALLASIEHLIPLFRYRPGRFRRAGPNLILAAGVLLTNLAFASITASLSGVVIRRGISLLGGLHLHPWILLLTGVAGLDFSAYIAHVLLHKLPLGWRFHRVHHSELEVDVTTAFRQHPGETVWRSLWQCFGTAVLGLPFWILPLYLSFSSLNALLEHANVRVGERFDRLLRVLIVTPNMHKVHHSRVASETDSNYSNIFSIWDRLFGTYNSPQDCRNLSYGLDGFDDSQKQHFKELVLEPFRRS